MVLVLMQVPFRIRRPLGISAVGVTGHRAGVIIVTANTDAQAREHVPRVVRELCGWIERIELHHQLIQLQPEPVLCFVQMADRRTGFILAAFGLWFGGFVASNNRKLTHWIRRAAIDRCRMSGMKGKGLCT